MREYYPVVFIPPELQKYNFCLLKLKYSQPFLPQEPKQLIPPQEPKKLLPPQEPKQPKKPTIIQKPKLDYSLIFFYIILFITFILAIFLIVQKNILFGFSLSIISFVVGLITYKKKEIYKKYQLKKYKQNRIELEFYPKKYAKWKKEKTQYLQYKSEYERLLKLYNSDPKELNSNELFVDEQNQKKSKVSKKYAEWEKGIKIYLQNKLEHDIFLELYNAKQNQINSAVDKQNQRELKVSTKYAYFEKIIEKYIQDKLEYEISLELYNTEQKERKSKILEAQKQLSKIKKTKPFNKKNKRKGMSESYFYSYLKSYFPNNIYIDKALLKEGYSEEYYYYPDFVYYDSDWNIYIDIEIDEPYDKQYRKPRHYIGFSKEQVRNNFFLENNWIVIRFSEEQVVKFPNSCCKKIAEIISKFNPLIFTEELKSIELKSIDSLKEMPRWSSEDAKKMAENHYREKYL